MGRLKGTGGGIVVVVATASLLAAGLGTAASAPHAGAKLASTPMLKVKLAHGKLTLNGPRTFHAGRVNVSLTVKGNQAQAQVVSFAKGYGFKRYIKDFQTFVQGGHGPSESKAGLAALNHLVDKTKFFGGFTAAKGSTMTGTIVLPTAGTYVIYDDTTGSDPHKLNVTGPEVKRVSPDSSGTIKATSAKRFRGATTAAAHGTITYKNVSSGKQASPHFLELQHVKKGTTRKDVEMALMSNSNSQPSWVLKGELQTDVIGPGQSMTFNTHLPKGEYVELCFFPDLQTGIPHAFMGMIGTITLN